MVRSLAVVSLFIMSACARPTPTNTAQPPAPAHAATKCNDVLVLAFERPSRPNEATKILLPLAACDASTSVEVVGFDRVVVRVEARAGFDAVSVGAIPGSIAFFALKAGAEEQRGAYADSRGDAVVVGRAFDGLEKAVAAMATP